MEQGGVRRELQRAIMLAWVVGMLMRNLGEARAAEYEVGGEKGWVVGAVNYSLWAANHTFFVGDFLVFNYLQEFHSVLEVTKENYETCDTTNPISEHHDGNTRLQLGKAKSFYFICGISKHCPLGQKLEVKALNLPPPSNYAKAKKAPPPLSPQPKGPPPVPLSSSSHRQLSPFNYHILLIALVLAFFTL